MYFLLLVLLLLLLLLAYFMYDCVLSILHLKNKLNRTEKAIGWPHHDSWI